MQAFKTHPTDNLAAWQTVLRLGKRPSVVPLAPDGYASS